MDSQTTILLFGTAVALIALASLGDAARRRNPLAWHAHLPWHGLMFAGTTLAVLLAAHLLTLQRG
jgi:hypothetical protein